MKFGDKLSETSKRLLYSDFGRFFQANFRNSLLHKGMVGRNKEKKKTGTIPPQHEGTIPVGTNEQ